MLRRKHTFGTDWNQFYALAGNEVQGLVDVGDFVEPHFASIGFRQGFPGNYFQEKHKLQTISEIFVDIFNRCPGFSQMGIAPCGECLKEKKDNRKVMDFRIIIAL